MNQTLHTATRIVCRSLISTTGGWLPHVMQCIDDYLTGWLCPEVLIAACEAGASEHTLEYIFEKTDFHWHKAVRAAVQGGHMHVLRWMTGREDGRGPWKEDFDHRLELAATHGHLDVVKWLLERGMDWHTLQKTGKDAKGYIEKSWLYRHCTADALNLAAEHGHFEVVKWIYGARTDTCSRYDSPISKAVANEHLTIAQWLHTTKREECSADASNVSAKNGHLKVLQWMDANHLFTCTKNAMEGAAGNGHLEVVKWLHQVHHECCSSAALRRAANSGNLELVEWLHENVHNKCHHTAPPMDTSTVAGRGHLDVLKWMHEHFPRSFSSDTMDAAARNGRIDAMTWLHENRREGCSRSAAYFAAQMGHLGVLKWIHTYYPNKFGPAAINVATVKGHLEVVRWLLENHPEGYTQHAPHSAAFWGHLDIFLYLLEHLTEGFPANDTQDIEVMCRFASVVPGNGRVTSDQLKMLQNIFVRRPAFLQRWLRFLVAISCSGTGNVAILDWVNQFGLELNSSEPIRNVVGCGDLKMLQWFFENGFEITDPDLLEVAAQSRCLEVVRWLSEHGHDVNSLKLIQFGDNIPIMRWLVERGLPLDLSTASALVLESRHIEIAWWAAEKDRKHLVLEALQKNDREVVWWILAHTKFLDKSARRSIREAIHHCPKDTYQWLEETMRQVEACRWCFFTSIKKRNEESAETDLFSTKRRRCDEVLE